MRGRQTGNRPMGRYRRKFQSRWLWLLVLVILAAYRAWEGDGGVQEQPPEALEEGIYHVKRVVDGDTLLLDSGARVRLQGIDTPETVREDFPVEAWGPEASEFTKDFVNQAQGDLRLTFGNERVDRYGRFLAFAWHGDRMLNEELVRNGLAQARPDYRYSGRMKRRLLAAQDEARREGLGIWSLADAP